MGDAPQGGGAGFPEQVRADVAQAYDTVYAAVNAEKWTDGVAAARTILDLLRPYPLTPAVPWPVHIEKAWCLFVLGMAAKSRRDWRKAAGWLQEAASVAPNMWRPSPTARALEQLGLVLAQVKEYATAVQELRRAIALFGNEPQRSAKLWLRLGQVYEHWGKRADAIRAYRKAAEAGHTYPLHDAPEWVHDAHAGIVRCSFRDDRAAGGPFWSHWLRAGRIGVVAFVALALGCLALTVMAVVAVKSGDYQAAGWWLALAGFLLVLAVLPSAHRVSGPGFAFELRERAAPGFAFDLPAPAHDEIPEHPNAS